MRDPAIGDAGRALAQLSSRHQAIVIVMMIEMLRDPEGLRTAEIVRRAMAEGGL